MTCLLVSGRLRMIGRQDSRAQLLPGGVFPVDLDEAEDSPSGRRKLMRRISRAVETARDKWRRLLYRYASQP